MKTSAAATNTNRSKGKKKNAWCTSTQTTNAQSYKGKRKVGESVGRLSRNRKPSTKGIELYINLKIGQQTYYVS